MLAKHGAASRQTAASAGEVLAPKLTQEFGLTGIIFYPGQRDLNERITWVDSDASWCIPDISGSDQCGEATSRMVIVEPGSASESAIWEGMYGRLPAIAVRQPKPARVSAGLLWSAQ